MIRTGSRFFFGLAAFAFVAAIVYGFASGGHYLGVFTAGLKAEVGEQFGYMLFAVLGTVAAFLGVLTVAFRDADVDEGPSEAEAEQVAAGPRPSVSPWPIGAAFSLAVLMVGIVLGPALVVVGLVGLGMVVVEWMVQGWADRASADADFNRALRNRVMLPFEIPVLAVVGAAVGVLAFSRVLLALSKDGSVVIATVVAAAILGLATLVAARPRVSMNAVAAILLVGGVAVIGSGIVAAAIGEREFHPIAEEHEGGESQDQEGEDHEEPQEEESSP